MRIDEDYSSSPFHGAFFSPRREDQSPIVFDLTWTSADDTPTRGELFGTLEVIREQQPDATSPEHQQSYAYTHRFLFPTDVDVDRTQPNSPSRQDQHFGIDINNGTDPGLNISTLRSQGVEFVYAKATYGMKSRVSNFAVFWPKLGQLKHTSNSVYRGAYHFLTPAASGKDQADTFIAYLKHVDSAGIEPDDLPPAVDLEWTNPDTTKDAWKGHDPDEIIDVTLACLKRLKDFFERSPVVYTNAEWWRQRTAGYPEKVVSIKRITDAGYRIWIADYRGAAIEKETPATPANMPWTLWQFTASSELTRGYPVTQACRKPSGAPTKECIDASVFKGKMDGFLAAFGLKS